jgi:hypothetical protein
MDQAEPAAPTAVTEEQEQQQQLDEQVQEEGEVEETEETPTAVAAAETPTAAAATLGTESLYASMYGSGLLLSADDVAGALQMSALPLTAAGDTVTAAADTTASDTAAAGDAGSNGSTADMALLPAVNTGSVSAATATDAAAAAEPWEGHASLYASIIAHSEDHEQPGSPFNFGESFAAALSAAGLDSLSGPSPPSGSPRESGSEDWLIVEADVEGAAARAAAAAPAAGEASSSGSSNLRRSWLGRSK